MRFGGKRFANFSSVLRKTLDHLLPNLFTLAFVKATRSFGLVVATSILLLLIAGMTGQLRGQTPIAIQALGFAPATSDSTPNATATITRANGDVVRLRGRERFRAITLLPHETITIQANLPQRVPNAPALAQPLDGGAVVSDLTVAADGTASLGFQVGRQSGLYRLLLGVSGRNTILRFNVE